MQKKANNYLRKFIYFDDTDPFQREMFFILDKVRYYQSRLVVKLLDDFFKKNNITANTPYDKVQMIVKLYINNMEAPEEQKNINVSSTAQNDLSTVLLSLAMALDRQFNGNIVNSTTPTTSPVQVVSKPAVIETNNYKVPDDIIPHEEMQIAADEEEDDDEDDSLMQMVSGFQSMVGE